MNKYKIKILSDKALCHNLIGSYFLSSILKKMVHLTMDVVQTQIKQISPFFTCQFMFHLNLSYKYYFMEAHLSQPINKITRKIFIKKKGPLEP